jgi:hypothetical protein
VRAPPALAVERHLQPLGELAEGFRGLTQVRVFLF